MIAVEIVNITEGVNHLLMSRGSVMGMNEKETKLERAKQVIQKHLSKGKFGIFNTRNSLGDAMVHLYDEGGLRIDLCLFHGYFEVFGLTKGEFAILKSFYYRRVNWLNR